MKSKKTLASVIFIGLFLSGCGGSDSQLYPPSIVPGFDKNPVPDVKDKMIKVIDGYLTNAQICADRNSNQICEASEILGLSKEGGLFLLPKEEFKYSLLAKVIAGETKDSDSFGELIRHYTLIAKAGSDVITPLTTLEVIHNQELLGLMETLNLSEAVVLGDYVEKKISGNETEKTEARKAHYIAKSLARSFLPTILEMNTEKLDFLIDKAEKRILSQETLGTLNELDSSLIVVDEFGNVTEEELFSDLNEYLTAEVKWNSFSSNIAASDIEGETINNFKDGVLTSNNLTPDNVEKRYEYITKGNQLTYSNAEGEKLETFIFQSKYWTVSIGEQYKDIRYWISSSNPENSLISKEIFSGKTWYEIGDLNPAEEFPTPIPFLITFQFNADATATAEIKYPDTVERRENMTWTIDENVLKIRTEGNQLWKEMQFITPYEKSNGVMLVVERGFGLMVNTKEQMTAILKNWESAIGNK